MHSSKATVPSRPLCESWYTSKKYESLGLNITRKNKLFLNLEDFFWKNYSSSLPLPYGIKGSELLLLKVLAVIASYDMPQSIESLDCRRCVVVGNGFSIKNTSLGGTINKYDVVIRVNDAPVRGYEADVGNKTTMRFFYPESASVNPYIHNDPDTVMVLVPFKQQDLRWMKEILYDEKRVRKGFWKPPPQIWQAKTSQIRVLDPFFLHETETRLLNLTVNVNPKSREVSERDQHSKTVNDAPVRGYEADVGNKTTMRFFYPESASVNPYIHNDPDTVMVLVPFKQQDLRWMKEILYDEKRVRKGFWKPPPQIWQAKTSQIRVLDPFFLHETETRLLNLTVNVNPKSREKSTQPTTGILAIYVALNYCDVVHVAGFGYPKVSEQKHPIHYYGYDTMKSMKVSESYLSLSKLVDYS
ncbi:SIA4C sialyltransferase, partial [Atractosteus spatula]|nr:SIA4C sialyltransferase [Atractosteus spatula]